ncbi:hypothetical protein K435DRAFT_961659 [Dendrothele bispora CBS 962.96]|uniref:DNA polymerase n=1 Tax=Dendrothele bispora (strain CBS 962.96) TaxID=1314807 RepID=A0A4S8MPZ3_DENBC|nr:hypothetical protein K435DRAFT_961659 [Dendrothele bispora CBS 962.96]
MSSNNLPASPSLQVQINQVDYYLTSPGPLDKSSLPLVPVIRVYGPSSAGPRVCLHVHQVYPYLFVEYLGELKPRHVKRYINGLKKSLDHAIALCLKRDPWSPESRYIHSIVLVKGIHFYGFHSSYSPFLKIMVADPSRLSYAASILRNGTVMSTRFHIYEAHINFTLQFLCDFGLYGCGWIDLGELYQRGTDEEDEDEVLAPSQERFLQSPHFRQSRMPLEVDVLPHQILNRYRVNARNMHHKLEIPCPSLPPEPLVLSVRELWEDERNRRRARGLNPSPELPIDPSDSSRGSGSGWVSEVRWWKELQMRIEGEAEIFAPPPQGWEGAVMSTFESIEALWDKEWKTWKPLKTTDDSSRSEISFESELTEDVTDGEDINIDIDVSILSAEDFEIENLDHAGFENLLEEEERPDSENEYVEESGYDEDYDLLGEALANSEDFEEDDTRDPLMDLDNDDDVLPVIATETLSDEDSTVSSESPRKTEPIESRVDLRFHPASPTSDDLIIQRSNILDVGDTKDASPREVSSNLQGPSSFTSNITRRLLQTSSNKLKLSSNGYIYSLLPPSSSQLLESLETYGLSHKTYQAPFYRDNDDAPPAPREYAGLVFHLKGGTGIGNLEEWVPETSESSLLGPTGHCASQYIETLGWEYANTPPSFRQVKKWLSLSSNDVPLHSSPKKYPSQIKGPTQANIYHMKTTLVTAPGKSERPGKLDLTILSVEVFAPPSTIGRISDSTKDALVAVSYTFQQTELQPLVSGMIVSDVSTLESVRIHNMTIKLVETELDLINELVDIVNELDPDIITGWDVQISSWGYLSARANSFGLTFEDLISRAPSGRGNRAQQWESRHTSTFQVTGRHVFNLWRVMRSEQTLNIYTFENVAFHILGKRVPKYSHATLVGWYNSTTPNHVLSLIRHLQDRSTMNIQMLNRCELVTKTAEFARVFGVDFYSVISRGSQYKVESFMFRLAKPESFVLLSPSKQDVGKQNAAECLPLVMEPQSALYTSPLVVLDFQSLYPSIMIAYNYCYSTCLGRVADSQGSNKLGVTELELPKGLLGRLRDHITIAPNGIVYAKPEVRKGLLGRMLTELLDTRVMVKTAMKAVRHDQALTRILNARQLGLKYIANVTYGYTSAAFSGRMPAIEIADSIVQSGRETLEKAINLINDTKKWGAEVVYGDTDSLFIYLKGKTKEQAFLIGNEMADAVTALNPSPIKLKFEKVYHPCVLMAKKRYVGFKYESVDDVDPVFDAKGIETVRRDGIPAQQKMTENCLKILFRTEDLSEVKDYCCESWTKILEHRVSAQDFIFAKEVRMGTYSDRGAPPPGVAVSSRRALLDPNAEAQYGERVPYVITLGPRGSKLVDRAMDPWEFLNDPHSSLDAEYYILRVLIPPLERIFNLVGADVRQWYNEMPKPHRQVEVSSPSKGLTEVVILDRPNIDGHFNSSQCIICGDSAIQGLCDDCFSDRQETLTGLLNRVKHDENRLKDAHRVCATCTSTSLGEPIHCESLDCPWLFARKKSDKKIEFLEAIQELLQDLGGPDTNPEETTAQTEENDTE